MNRALDQPTQQCRLWWGEALAAHVHAQSVDAERVRDHVQQLPTIPDTVRTRRLSNLASWSSCGSGSPAPPRRYAVQRRRAIVNEMIATEQYGLRKAGA